MTSPLATRRRADEAHQAKAVLQYRLIIATSMAFFMVLMIAAIGVGFAKMDRYDLQNQEWNLRQ